ncbi:hypothetical protein F503_02442 [Ophiostoma piceae UAMH 11346]|uniref:Uncharacterized protein n=1 Tax=Ophiostoma piceae (strain UAMH 11346) TaxID=1262450 RepID=S3BYJ0_OPHP1|nr:hypothetical protein F503_02442 [Ophiostoma piceae UAMH 11346]
MLSKRGADAATQPPATKRAKTVTGAKIRKIVAPPLCGLPPAAVLVPNELTAGEVADSSLCTPAPQDPGSSCGTIESPCSSPKPSGTAVCVAVAGAEPREAGLPRAPSKHSNRPGNLQPAITVRHHVLSSFTSLFFYLMQITAETLLKIIFHSFVACACSICLQCGSNLAVLRRQLIASLASLNQVTVSPAGRICVAWLAVWNDWAVWWALVCQSEDADARDQVESSATRARVTTENMIELEHPTPEHQKWHEYQLR